MANGTLPPDPVQVLSHWTGMNLAGRAPEMLRFIEERATLLGFPSAGRYVDAVIASGGEEAAALLEQVTVSHSWLFRDAEQLELCLELLQKPLPGIPLEVWIPGCAGGEDAYSLAMAADQRGIPVSILATDVSPRAIRRAESGRVAAESLRALPAEMKPYLRESGTGFQVDPRLRRSLRFLTHNVLQPAPKPGAAIGYTLILCRNVLLHFTPEYTQAALLRLSAALAPGGVLLLGAAEHELGSPELERTLFANRWLLKRRTGASRSTVAKSSRPAVAFAAPHPPPDPPPAAPRPPQTADPERLARAAQELQSGQAQAARNTISDLLARHPDSGDALLLGGIAEYMLGNHDRAVEALRAALAADADLWPAELYLALAFAARRNLEEAKQAYERLVGLPKTSRRRGGPVVELLSLDSVADDLFALAKKQLRLLLAKGC